MDGVGGGMVVFACGFMVWSGLAGEACGVYGH